MAEIAFLDAARAYLLGPAGLSVPPASVGIGVPAAGDPTPAIVLALADLARIELGLGGGLTEITSGALEVVSTIDLADPVLPGPEGFPLLDPGRTLLTLPHGGLIRADALDGAFGPQDIAISVAGAPFTLVAGDPGADEFTVEPNIGQVTFGAALPAAGNLVATYHLGIWERSTTTVTGTLLLDVWDDDLAAIGTLSAEAVRALLAAPGSGLPTLKKIRLGALGAVSPPGTPPGRLRMRPASFAFEYEHVVDAPVSSGGIIERIPITSLTPGFVLDPETGALVETVAQEPDQ